MMSMGVRPSEPWELDKVRGWKLEDGASEEEAGRKCLKVRRVSGEREMQAGG